MRNVTFDAKLNANDMYEFNMYHAYTSSQGWMSFIFAALAFIATYITWGSVPMGYSVAYIVIGFLFLFYMPVILKLRSKAQVSGVLQGSLHYSLEDKGVVVSVPGTEVLVTEPDPEGEQEAVLPWNLIYKVVTTKNELLIFSNRVNAYVIPKRDVEAVYPEVKAMMEEKLPSHRRKLKW
jgi:hypothetical protein